MSMSLTIKTRRQVVELTSDERTVLAHALGIISDPSDVSQHLRNISSIIRSSFRHKLGVQFLHNTFNAITSPARDLCELVVNGGVIDPASSHMLLTTILAHTPEWRNTIFPSSGVRDFTALQTALAQAVRKMYYALIDGGPVEITLGEDVSEEDTEVKDLGYVYCPSLSEDQSLICPTQESVEAQEMAEEETRLATKKQLRLRKVVDEVNALLTDANLNTDTFIVDLFSDVIPQFKIVEEHKKRVTLEVTNAPVFAQEATATYTHLKVAEALSRIVVSVNGLYDCFVEPIHRAKVSRSCGRTTLARKQFQMYLDELAENCSQAIVLTRNALAE